MIVVLQMAFDAETRTQRRGEQATSCSCPNKSERAEGELNAASTRTLVDHNVDTIIFHCRVEIFLYNRAEPMYLVDKQHIVLLERSEDTGEVAGLVEHRTRRNLETHTKLVCHNPCESGLAKAWRAE